MFYKVLHCVRKFFILLHLFCQVGFPSPVAKVRDLFEHKDLGQFKDVFMAEVKPDGVVMVKLSPV